VIKLKLQCPNCEKDKSFEHQVVIIEQIDKNGDVIGVIERSDLYWCNDCGVTVEPTNN
jgi:uncharacterized Zn finger protein